ncbi:hypothetical protein ASG14_08570 [Pedobacter sp. Leaf194]|nr:hypothetical protein ASG14_08570 [Pedobacter sp. Leaf194]
MRKMDKELIDHIKHNLQAHEETYTPGAWERFNVPEEKKKRGIVYWPLWSAAAIILVVTAFFVLRKENSNHTNQIVKTSKSFPKKLRNPQVEKSLEKVATGDLTKASARVEENNLTRSRKPDLIENNNSDDDKLLTVRKTDHELEGYQTKISDNNVTGNEVASQSTLSGTIYSEKIESSSKVKLVLINPEKKKIPQSKLTFEQLLEQDSHRDNIAKTSKNKALTKWEPGLFVAPSIGNDNKVNMNYGFSLSYNLADKLSISSGIAYGALSTTTNPSASSESLNDGAANAPSAAKAVAYVSASKSLESINANVRGINIPLELKYNISSKLYTGIGVSALAITNNKQNNNYVVSSARNTAVANTFGITEQKMLIVTERVSEAPTETNATDKLIGFYNFSLGYKQKISKKNNFAVEPFLRLPMKTFSTDKLNLTNGGIKLKFDF